MALDKNNALLSTERLEQIKDRVDAHERTHIAQVAIWYGHDVADLLAENDRLRRATTVGEVAGGVQANRQLLLDSLAERPSSMPVVSAKLYLDDTEALLTALPGSLLPVGEGAKLGGWVSVEDGPPKPIDTPNGPAPFSADVLLWGGDEVAPVVGYFDYRAGYECFQAYEVDMLSSVTHWQLITPPQP